MKYYLILQWRMFNRQLVEFGLPVGLSYILGVLIFVGGSIFLFAKTIYAPYLLLIITFFYLIKLSEQGRIDFLKSITTNQQYLRTRLVENLVITVPFLAVLISFNCLWHTGALLGVSAILAVAPTNHRFAFTLPTPFYKYPFEFPVGFRKTWLIVIFAYLLSGISVFVGNFNLGVFSLALIFLVCLTYFGEPEDEFFVWIYSFSPKVFLMKKVGQSIFYGLILTLPSMLIVGMGFWENMTILLLVLLAGSLLLMTIIFAKYSAFPDKMSVPQGLLFGLCIWFPPLAVVAIPIFYLQATKRIKTYLL